IARRPPAPVLPIDAVGRSTPRRNAAHLEACFSICRGLDLRRCILTTATLSPALRALIDERLDGIDRVLRHARTPRPERLEILDSVQKQILEMLAQQKAADTT